MPIPNLRMNTSREGREGGEGVEDMKNKLKRGGAGIFIMKQGIHERNNKLLISWLPY